MQETRASQVLFEELPAKRGRLGIIILNRPESLNALSLQMLIDITNKLNTWKLDPEVHAVIIKSSNPKAFCAGGDIKRLYTLGPEHYHKEVDYFRIEYRLSLLINRFPKPYISLLDGVAMGGGLGLSVNGSRVIATESLRMAMPETAIGLYPDTGASHFLSRCPDHLGMYLGLTGNSIGINDAIFCELVDALIPRDKHGEFLQVLSDHDLSIDAIKTIDKIIEHYKITPGSSELAQHLRTIKCCFSLDSVEAVVKALEQEDSTWAAEQLAIIRTRSPSSLKITHMEITKAKTQDLATCLEMEINLTVQVLQSHDLYEGIRAVLIDKSRDAKWQPATLEELDDSIIDAMFEIKCKL